MRWLALALVVAGCGDSGSEADTSAGADTGAGTDTVAGADTGAGADTVAGEDTSAGEDATAAADVEVVEEVSYPEGLLLCSTLDGLYAWYDATDANIVVADGKVTSWPARRGDGPPLVPLAGDVTLGENGVHLASAALTAANASVATTFYTAIIMMTPADVDGVDIFGTDFSSGRNGSFVVTMDGGTLSGQQTQGDTPLDLRTIGGFAADSNYVVAYTFQLTLARLFSRDIQSDSRAFVDAHTSLPYVVGGRCTGSDCAPDRKLTGDIQHVLVFSRTLAPNEIIEVANWLDLRATGVTEPECRP